MPYTGTSDPALPTNVRDMPAKARARWVAIWNDTYRRCQRKRGQDCEGRAFRTANGFLKKLLSLSFERPGEVTDAKV